MAKMPFAEDNHVIEAVRRIEPISLSAWPFCQGDRAELGWSRMVGAPGLEPGTR